MELHDSKHLPRHAVYHNLHSSNFSTSSIHKNMHNGWNYFKHPAEETDTQTLKSRDIGTIP